MKLHMKVTLAVTKKNNSKNKGAKTDENAR